MTDNLPALTYYGKWSSIWAVSPQPRLSPLFRRLLWGVRETKNGAHVTRVTIVYLAKEAWRNFRELRECELRRIPKRRSSRWRESLYSPTPIGPAAPEEECPYRRVLCA